MDGSLPPPLTETLRRVASAMEGARDPWWIIASAAMALHGARPIEVADVDLLTSERDTETLLATLRISPLPGGGSDRFRSRIFARWEAPPVPVEIMAGFEVLTPEGWQFVRPLGRLPKQLGNMTLFVPPVDELLAHCRLFGRPKDEQRATILQRLES
ncbi:hypothetical protein [Sphingomonas sp. PR090111-T3T-6A]|uniref:hypothetical protein n=1 Tax=Sphingomonas sp. PR090111-T3T-6A TaxID=685778 RepID=UPI00037DAC60|nr:hypothetical protein [Sphingomonas sp. PR090111-T3T-6A]